jgi:L-2-hydroxyglutarate oxidase LhgO
MKALREDAIAVGIDISVGVKYLGRRQSAVRTTTGDYEPGYVINAAGLYADRVAHDFGFAARYRILPFKGAYLYSRGASSVRVHIYPVPDPNFPFLGVHYTVAVDGAVKIGPTAKPALWREQYGLANLRLDELAEIGWRGLRLLASDPLLRRHALKEIRKSSRRHIVALAAQLARDASVNDFREWGKPGIRAQVYDTQRGALEMDFLIEGDSRSMHILNVVSPGLTCALPFAEFVVDRVEREGHSAHGNGTPK